MALFELVWETMLHKCVWHLRKVTPQHSQRIGNNSWLWKLPSSAFTGIKPGLGLKKTNLELPSPLQAKPPQSLWRPGIQCFPTRLDANIYSRAHLETSRDRSRCCRPPCRRAREHQSECPPCHPPTTWNNLIRIDINYKCPPCCPPTTWSEMIWKHTLMFLPGGHFDWEWTGSFEKAGLFWCHLSQPVEF